MLPTLPSRPRVEVRTLNGYHFWPVPRCGAGDVALPLSLRRAFAVQPPRPAGRLDGDETRCVIVELAPSVRERVEEELRGDLAPDDALWSSLCRTALSSYLWERDQLPPEVLLIGKLAVDQVAVVRARAAAERC